MAGPGVPNQPRSPAAVERDGTSQADRALPALHPGYVAIDERSLVDALAFARAYGKELRYFDGNNQPAGDFSAFIPKSLDLDQVAAFIANPSQFSPATAPDLFRPHFTLFLTFLQLLDRTRQSLNGLTARHLDYYYRQYLGFSPKPSVPDRVNVIVDLARGVRSVLLPAGTMLRAGSDSRGIDRSYATDRDLLVTRAQLARLRSLYIDCRRTTLRQAPLRHENDKERACELLFRIALGDRIPFFSEDRPVTFSVLVALRDALRQEETQTFLPIPILRDLTARLARRPPAPAEWDGINEKLEIAGRAKRGGAMFSLDRSSQDFLGNLTLAVGPVDLSTLPEIDSVDDLYDQRGRSDVQAFIGEKLYFRDRADFLTMMQLKRTFDMEWREINLILQQAGAQKRNDQGYSLAVTHVDSFFANLLAATSVTQAHFDAYVTRIRQMEDAFCLPAELFALVIDEVVAKPLDAWDPVYPLLEEAHQEKQRKQRRSTLRSLREATPPARLVDLIRYVLGEPSSPAEDATALDRVAPHIGQSNADKLPTLADAENWERIYTLLELAWRSRVGEAPAEQTEWINLYPADDATTVRPGDLAHNPEGTPRFAPFGAARPRYTASPAPDPVLGWAISSPLLFLREGNRTITLTLGFSATAVPLSDLFVRNGELAVCCEISTARGFIACPLAAPRSDSYSTLTGTQPASDCQALQLVCTLSETVDAVAPLPGDPDGIKSPYPILRLMLRPIFDASLGQHRASYPELAGLRVLAAHVQVDVSGLRSVQAQNDESILDVKKPFEPFGSQPAVGSRLLLGHPEIVAKDLDHVQLNMQWMGAPASLSTHYAAYGLSSSESFSARLCVIDRSRETTMHAAVPLFGNTGTVPVSFRSGPTPELNHTQAAATLASQEPPEEDLLTWNRFFALELNAPDFQHANYPIIASSKAVALAVAATQGGTMNAADYLVRPPYTPKLKSLTVGYRASLELRFEAQRSNRSLHRVYHIHPFGFCDSEAERDPDLGLPFLPRYDNDGELYLGLQDLQAPQNVSIFVQVAEGSADPDLPQMDVRWSYLSGDRWLPLDRHIVLDTTRSLRSSGILELALPAVEPSTRMRDALYWIRASLARDTRSVCDIVGMHTQAVSATFVDRGNAPDHFREPLPAGSIAQLEKAQPGIAGLRQPYTSYGGRMAESDATWALRVSERLRHKGRAVTPWDYERLALQRFPDLHKAKCIPASPKQPGRVTLIVIPNVRNKLPFEPFAPKAPANLLAEVREYLQARAPSYAEVDVRNAHYVAVRVRLGVRFRSDGNEEYYKDQLNEALNRFLSPWAYEEGADIALGGKIYASRIVDFVDRLPFVDYVAGIKLFRSEDGAVFRPVPRPNDQTGEGYAVATERPDAVLVAARQHVIDVLSGATYAENLVTGIDFMKLEFDFIVSEG